MGKHPFIGKLCQYKSEHRNKVLFTYKVSEDEMKEIKYSLLIWDERDRVSANTMIPTWYYQKYIVAGRHDQGPCPDPDSYHTPYAIKYSISNGSWVFNYAEEKVETFLIIDSKKFVAKIGNIVAGERTLLKALFSDEDDSKTFWLDEKWIEPFSSKETYMEVLKARMLNKLRQNT
mgnify:CR=1 FL=1